MKRRLEQMHDIDCDSRACGLIKIVLLDSESWSQIMLSQALQIHEPTIMYHCNNYVFSEKLNPENGGSQNKLFTAQMILIIEYSTEKTYSTDGTFELDYSVSGMNKWLYHNWFSHTHTKSVLNKFNEGKQRTFLEFYEVLKASCDKNEALVFINAVHPTLSTSISHDWIQTGQDNGIETESNYSQLNIIGVLNLSNIGAIIIQDYKCINSEKFVFIFCKLEENSQLTHKLHIIL